MKKLKKNYILSKLMSFILVLFFLCGLLITLYPIISNELAKYNTIMAIESFQTYTANMNEEQLEMEWSAARVYNDNLAGDPVHDPFMADSGMVLPENYIEVLNPSSDGVMGYLEVPVVDITLMIAHGTSDEVLEQYAGHIEQTSLPIGSESSHAVLTAHTGLPAARLFTDLINVKPGDKFYIYVLDHKLTYQVDQIEVILPEEVGLLRIVSGKDYVTLLTCTPYGVNSHRLLVRGERIPNEREAADPAKAFDPRLLIITGIILVLLLLFYVWRKNRKTKRTALDNAERINKNEGS
ncbi:MAG: class C sortase [Lachnospiraceae bacterium]